MKKGELTRQHILETAAPVFNRRGFAGCSMQDLMEATGLEKGGLYRHFASKEELAVASFEYAMQRTLEVRTAAEEGQPGAMPRRRQTVRAFVEIPSPVAGGCPLMNAAADADTGSPAVLAAARGGMALWKSRICAVLEEGMRSREIREDVEPRRTANAVIATLEGALMICRLEGTREAMVDAQASLEGLLLGLGR